MKKFESKSDFKDRIASIAMGIPVEEVIMNRGARTSAAREKWVAKHFGTSHVTHSNKKPRKQKKTKMTKITIIGAAAALFLVWILSNADGGGTTLPNGDVINYGPAATVAAAKTAQASPSPTPTPTATPQSREDFLRSILLQQAVYPNDLRRVGGSHK